LAPPLCEGRLWTEAGGRGCRLKTPVLGTTQYMYMYSTWAEVRVEEWNLRT